MSEPTFSLYPVKGVIASLTVVLAGTSALCAMIATGNFSGPPRLYDEVMGWFGFFFFALVASLFVDQLFTRGSAIDVSRDGIRDVRFSPDLIPWSAVDSITRPISYLTILLHLKKGAREKFRRTWRRMMFDACNAVGGWPGVYITTMGLSGSVDDLLAAIEQFAPAHVALPTYNRPIIEAPKPPADPNDPDYWLCSPPADARVEHYRDRRVVTLKDGRVVAELMTGRGRWFTSFEEFRDFIGD